MTINKKNLDATQLEYLAKAEALQKELVSLGFMATRIEKLKDDRCTFDVIYFDGTHDYNIRKDWKGNTDVYRKEYPNYEHVSSHKRSEVYKAHELDNMKVLSAKKLQARIDTDNAIHAELEKLELDSIKKHNDFIVSLDGLTVEYDKEKKNGSIVKNGIEFSFQLCDDGYVSKKVSLHYSVDNSIEAFKMLSDNKYTK